jgi:hypothetical protein
LSDHNRDKPSDVIVVNLPRCIMINIPIIICQISIVLIPGVSIRFNKQIQSLNEIFGFETIYRISIADDNKISIYIILITIIIII